METKICYKCREEKPLEEFYKNKTTKDGRKSACKICSSQINKLWYQENLEEVINRARGWRNNNREKANAIQRKYDKKNSEKINAEGRRSRENCRPFYIKSMLKKQGFIDSQITPDIIEEKRNIIRTRRIILKINQSINKKTKTL